MTGDLGATRRQDWYELLDELETHTGMWVGRPRLMGASALLRGYGMGRGEDTMGSFQAWVSRRFPVEGGYPSPLTFECVVAGDMFDRMPRELDEAEDLAAAQRLCQLVREFLRDSPRSDG